jgi:hypothetical protein
VGDMDEAVRREEAIAYVARHGTVVQRARLGTLLEGTLPDEAALDAWRADRNRDGGWHARPADEGADPGTQPPPSTLPTTLRALGHAWEMETGVRPEVRTGLLWVVGRQRPVDGAFVDEAPTDSGGLEAGFARGEEERAPALWTAAALATLDTWVSGVPAFNDARTRAYEWLCRNVQSWEDQPPRAAWLAASAALLRERAGSARVSLPLAQLTMRLDDPDRTMNVRELAELVISLVGAGLPATKPPANLALVRLARMQRADGALATGNEDAVEGTLAGLRALMLAALRVRRT